MAYFDHAKVERVAWAILQELHGDVSDDKKPLSWSDLDHEQSERLFCAAHPALNMAIRRKLLWPDRRKQRIEGICSSIMKAIGTRHLGLVDYREIHRSIFEVLYLDGVEFITETDRVQAGLPPRDPNGFTDHELQLLELARMQAILKPPDPM